MQKGFAYTKLADRLMGVAELSDEDLELLTAMPCTIRHFSPHESLLRESDRPSRCCLLLQGYLCWKDHNGQITSIYVPGDVPDLHTIVMPRLDARLTALGSAVVAFVPHAFFHEVSSASPNLHRALQLLMNTDTSCLRRWIINLGSRDSLTRAAHLICEVAARLQAMGLAKDNQFASPFTQSDLASACAISPVHANRIVQELRSKHALKWHSRIITIVDWQSLCQIGCFEPDYLGLRDQSMSSHYRSLRSIAQSETMEFPAMR